MPRFISALDKLLNFRPQLAVFIISQGEVCIKARKRHREVPSYNLMRKDCLYADFRILSLSNSGTLVVADAPSIQMYGGRSIPNDPTQLYLKIPFVDSFDVYERQHPQR